MQLIQKYKFKTREEYYCELTKDLDKLAGLPKEWKHYILVDDSFKNEKCLPIRIPGGTVGSLFISDVNAIEKITIDRNYVVKTYPENIEDIVNEKYCGVVIENL